MRFLPAACLVLALGCSSVDHHEGQPCGAQPAIEQSYVELERGSSSGLTAAGLHVARTEAEWQALWAQHSTTGLPRPTAPDVNFEELMVVCVSAGQRPTAGWAIAVENVQLEADTLWVRVKTTGPAPEALVPQVVTAPVVMVLVHQHQGRVALRQE
jgi:hypothetical protein